MESISIRPCTEAELEHVITKLPPFGLDHHHKSRFFEQVQGTATYLIAWFKQSPVGTLLICWNGDGKPRVDDFLQHTPSLKALAVRPDLQSQGIGTKLIQYAENLAKEKGYTQLGLAVGTENLRAIKLYKRLQYTVYEPIAPFPIKWTYIDEKGVEQIDGETCIYLRKHLR